MEKYLKVLTNQDAGSCSSDFICDTHQIAPPDEPLLQMHML